MGAAKASRVTEPSPHFDVLLVGGGLSAGLIALALARHRPDLSVAIIESGETFGGNHTWSSFASDLSPEGVELVAPIIAHRWSHYEVRFPAYRRPFDHPYQSAVSEKLNEALEAAIPPERRFTGTPVAALTPDSVTLADQRVLRAAAVIDARGQRQSPHLELGFQKFVGLEVEFEEPHGLTGPIIMDATIDQHDGYRFVYTLPFSPTTALIEDTYYADGPVLDRDAVAAFLEKAAQEEAVDFIVFDHEDIAAGTARGAALFRWGRGGRRGGGEIGG